MTTLGLGVSFLEVGYGLAKNTLYPFYLGLITRCVECTFATSSAQADWEDTRFRNTICECVESVWEKPPYKIAQRIMIPI